MIEWIGRFFGTILPFVNVLCCIGNLDGFFDLIGNFFKAIWNFFAIPLVPNRSKK